MNSQSLPSRNQQGGGDVPAGLGAQVAAYMHLSKLRLCLLVVMSESAAFLAAKPYERDWLLFGVAALGTLASAMGANALNQFYERERDAMMHRTKRRPIPSGKLSPSEALAWGISASIFGVGILAFTVNWLSACLSLITIVTYVLAYTPMKPASPTNTLAGSLVGAIPPLIGWAAATGSFSPGAAALGAILFIWQVPHFLSLAWLYRDDYKRGGFAMLPVLEPGVSSARISLVYSVALIPSGILPTLLGVSGWAYGMAALVAGVSISAAAAGFAVEQTARSARRLFVTSLAYLPILLLLMVANPAPRTTGGLEVWPAVHTPGAPPHQQDPTQDREGRQ